MIDSVTAILDKEGPQFLIVQHVFLQTTNDFDLHSHLHTDTM